MISGKTVSINEVLKRVTRLFPNYTINFADAVSDIADGLAHIGAPLQYVDATEKVVISNYKGELPCNIAYIIQVKDDETQAPYRYASNTFHSEYHITDSPDFFVESGYTYTVSKNHIQTNQEDTVIRIAYQGYPVDDNGFPLIPDDVSYVEALVYYISEKIAFELLIKDKIRDNVYQRISDKKDWYMGQAGTTGTIPSPDQMESISNQWVRMISRPLAQGSFYIDNNLPETFRND
jgi:hypothetical protein